MKWDSCPVPSSEYFWLVTQSDFFWPPCSRVALASLLKLLSCGAAVSPRAETTFSGSSSCSSCKGSFDTRSIVLLLRAFLIVDIPPPPNCSKGSLCKKEKVALNSLLGDLLMEKSRLKGRQNFEEFCSRRNYVSQQVRNEINCLGLSEKLGLIGNLLAGARARSKKRAREREREKITSLRPARVGPGRLGGVTGPAT